MAQKFYVVWSGRQTGYPYCGHGTILGTPARQWQDCESVLVQFGRRASEAKEAYRRFVAEGVTLERRSVTSGRHWLI
ncbi:MAG: hypothetical protein ACREQ7_03505 [Candidatus Binatia bacterium]